MSWAEQIVKTRKKDGYQVIHDDLIQQNTTWEPEYFIISLKETSRSTQIKKSPCRNWAQMGLERLLTVRAIQTILG